MNCRRNTKHRCRFCGQENRTGQEPCPAFTPKEAQHPNPFVRAEQRRAKAARQERRATLKGGDSYTYTMRKRKHKGLGDLLEAIFARLGIKRAVAWLNAKLGSTCDCDRRKALFNKLVPFCEWGNRRCWATARKEWGTVFSAARAKIRL